MFVLQLVFLFLSPCTFSTPEEPEITFEELYQHGKNSYTSSNWHDCIAFFLRGIEDFQYFVGDTIWCREKCMLHKFGSSRFENAVLNQEVLEVVQMYAIAQHSLCLIRCKDERFTSRRPSLSDYSVFIEFHNRKPYHYLQFCYWKIGDLNSAVRSAYTYLIANPNHKETIDNLSFYMNQEGFLSSMLIDSLRNDFEKKYVAGFNAYSDENWPLCIDEFEAAVREFFDEERKCRLLCDDQITWEFIHEPFPEYTVLFTGSYVSVLRCRNGCPRRLSVMNGRFISNLLSSIYDYLQICYYKVSRGREACQSVANSLLLKPDDPIMRRNRLFYSMHYQNTDLFEPSQIILAYYKRTKIEAHLVEFVEKKYKRTDGELSSEHIDDRTPLNLEIFAYDDAFDYAAIKNPPIAEHECDLLYVTYIFKPLKYLQKLIVQEIRYRLERTYSVTVNNDFVTCNAPGESMCKFEKFFISFNVSKCGIFFDNFIENTCMMSFCIGE